MKIKLDFVSNSSSTSFTMQLRSAGHFPNLDIDLRNHIYMFSSKYITTDQYSDHNSISLNLLSGKDEGEQDLPDYRYVIQFEFIDNEKLGKVMYLEIMGSTSYLSNYNNELIDRLWWIIDKILDLYPDRKDVNGEIVFSQMYESITGDGWGSGDPWGEFSTTKELIKVSTKIGTINIKNGKIKIKTKMI